MLLYQILAYAVHRKILKSHIRTINLKYQLQHGMKNLKCLIDHIYIRYSRLLKKKHGEKADNKNKYKEYIQEYIYDQSVDSNCFAL